MAREDNLRKFGKHIDQPKNRPGRGAGKYTLFNRYMRREIPKHILKHMDFDVLQYAERDETGQPPTFFDACLAHLMKIALDTDHYGQLKALEMLMNRYMGKPVQPIAAKIESELKRDSEADMDRSGADFTELSREERKQLKHLLKKAAGGVKQIEIQPKE